MRAMSMILWLCMATTLIGGDESPRFPVDPVALMAGNEVPGNEDLYTQYQGTTYVFASKSNQEAFLKEPSRYALQMGGACARMGPLSGKGNTEIFAVNDNKLYVFGSEGCRKTFLSDPSRAMDPDHVVPQISKDQEEEARITLQKMLTAMGGTENLKAVSHAEYTNQKEVERGDQTLTHHRRMVMDFPSNYHYESDWNTNKFHRTLKGDQGSFEGHEGSWAMVPEQVRAMKREFASQLLVLARNLDDENVQAQSLGEEDFDGHRVTRVLVAHNGLNQTLLIDAKTGELRAQRYRGRGSDRLFGDLEKRFSKYETVGGISLPTEETVFFNGTLWETISWQLKVH